MADYNIILSASKNETYDSRTGTVTIAYENQTSTITIVQSQNDELIVTQKEFEIGSEGGELRIPVSTQYTIRLYCYGGSKGLDNNI